MCVYITQQLNCLLLTAFMFCSIAANASFSSSNNKTIEVTGDVYTLVSASEIAGVVSDGDDEIVQIVTSAYSNYKEGYYELAAEYFQKAYVQNALSDAGIYLYADCLRMLEKYKYAQELYLSVSDWATEQSDEDRASYYYGLQLCCSENGEYEESIKYGQRALPLAGFTSNVYPYIVSVICRAYKESGNKYKAFSFAESQVQKYLSYTKQRATDAWSYGSRDEILGHLYFIQCLEAPDVKHSMKYLSLSAAWGYRKAIEWCVEDDIHYLTQPKNFVF